MICFLRKLYHTFFDSAIAVSLTEIGRFQAEILQNFHDLFVFYMIVINFGKTECEYLCSVMFCKYILDVFSSNFKGSVLFMGQ